MAAAFAGLVAAILLAAGCDLPQNESPSEPEPDGGSASGGDGVYSLLRLGDKGGKTEGEVAPGADIDSVVVFRDGTFLAAGCRGASLFGVDETLHGDNPNVDPEGGSLSAREASEAGGFVSLGSGTLLCELPVNVRSGDVVEVWEMEADGKDGWTAAVAEDADSDFVSVGGSFAGSAQFTVP